jgi:SAM-dependent methyltransferase
MGRGANADVEQAWNGPEGQSWAEHADRYDRTVEGHHHRLFGAAAIAAGERVLDVGCGAGQTTCDAAERAAAAVGVDLSAPLLAVARRRAAERGLGNVELLRADAQTHAFARGRFDVVISRFGAMFFADPVAAFTNLAGALRSGGRLAMVAWRPVEDNEWFQAIMGALLADPGQSPPAGRPGPFGLADADRGAAWLAAAGFDPPSIRFEPVDGPMHFGADAADALAFLCAMGPVRGWRDRLDERQRPAADAALRALVEAHCGDGGVRLGSAVWLITARTA